MSQMTIGKKITLSFGIIIVLLLCLVLTTKFGINNIVSNAAQVIDGNVLDRNLAQKEIDHLNWVAKVNRLLTDETVTVLDVQTDDHKCGFGKWLYGEGRKNAEILVPELAPLLKKIEVPHKKLHDSAIKIKEVYWPGNIHLPNIITEMETGHHRWAGNVRDAIIQKSTTLDVQTDPTQCMLGTWMSSEEAAQAYQTGSAEYKEIWDTLPPSHNALHESAIQIKEFLAAGDFAEATEIVTETTLPLLGQTVDILRDLKAEAQHLLEGTLAANDIYAQESVPALFEVQTTLKSIRELAREKILSEDAMFNSAKQTNLTSLILGLAAILGCMIVGFLTSGNITKILKDVTGRLGFGAAQIAAASGQIASASQSLADGASNQAASLEETSASLEEMSAMARQNSDSAGQADALMREADQAITAADGSMVKLTKSMHEISSASAETQKIVKTIDEIAFQTNLLALNAAVEAARAGEAGAGFAVVADEVRNLAMRAAEAAKNTSTLIDGTVEKIKIGENLLTETSKRFKTTTEATVKVSSLISEIAIASKEQNQGVSQVNTAVTEIDTVTQENAASAEESASASQELSSQAAMMEDLVEEMQRLVGVTLTKRKHAAKPQPAPVSKRSAAPRSAPPKRREVKALPSSSSSDKEKRSPEQIIPMEEDEFEDF